MTGINAKASLPSGRIPGGLFRVDSAAVLKRFFHLERALTIATSAWIPAANNLETKSVLAKAAWEDALTGDALRTRVFELKYPDRSLDVGDDWPLVRLFEAAQHAPSVVGLMRGLSEVLIPALAEAYDLYLADADDIADAPTRRFLELALRELEGRKQTFTHVAATERASTANGAVIDQEASDWVEALTAEFKAVTAGEADETHGRNADPGFLIAPGRKWELSEVPGRDPRYFKSTFYWPDNFDDKVSYGHGLLLQLRSAVSHINEVWAVDTAAANLVQLSPELGWEFTVDAARWLYDESRHMNMGRTRLERWGLKPDEIPLGGYIYEACAGENPITRLAMLAYFETKNIGKKRDRVEEFSDIGDESSARDMDFDWADEGIHAAYGRKWLKALLEHRGERADSWPQLHDHCEELVARRVADSSQDERASLIECVDSLIGRARALATVA